MSQFPFPGFPYYGPNPYMMIRQQQPLYHIQQHRGQQPHVQQQTTTSCSTTACGKPTAKLPTKIFKSHSTTRRCNKLLYNKLCQINSQQQNQQQPQHEQQKDVKEDEEKKRKHEIDGLIIKVNVSLIYGVKNKIC